MEACVDGAGECVEACAGECDVCEAWRTDSCGEVRTARLVEFCVFLEFSRLEFSCLAIVESE